MGDSAALEEAGLHITLQEVLTNISEENLEQTKKIIIESPFVKDDSRMAAFVDNIFCIVPIRPKKVPLLADLVSFIMNSVSDDKPLKKFKPLFFRNITRSPDDDKGYRVKIPLFYFLLECFKKGAFPFTEISPYLERWTTDKSLSPNQLFLLFFIFLPEIRKHEGDLYEKLYRIVMIKKSDGYISDDLMLIYPAMHTAIEEDRWDDHREYTKYGCLRNSVAFALKYDDVELLDNVVQDTKDFDFNQCVEAFPIEPSLFVHKATTLAQYAAFFGSINCFKYLLSHGADLNKSNIRRRTISDFAVDGGNTEIIDIVSNAGFSFTSTLRTATEFRIYDAFDKIYSKANPEDEEFIKEQQLALRECAKSNNFRTLKLLIERGVPPTASYKDGMMLPHFAAANGHCGMVQFLLMCVKLDVNCQAQWGMTPLHFAAKAGFDDVVEFLLSVPDVNPQSVTNSGWTPLHLSSRHGHVVNTKLLMAAPGYTPDVKDRKGNTPLHCAAEHGHLDVCLLLLDKGGANINSINSHLQTPMHLAASKNCVDVAEMLIARNGYSPEPRDDAGLTAYEVATDDIKVLFEERFPEFVADVKKANRKKCTIA